MAESQHDEDALSSQAGTTSCFDNSDVVMVDVHRNFDAQAPLENCDPSRSPKHTDPAGVDSSMQVYSNGPVSEDNDERHDKVDNQLQIAISSESYWGASPPQEPTNTRVLATLEGDYAAQHFGQHDALASSDFMDDQFSTSQYSSATQCVAHGNSLSAPTVRVDAPRQQMHTLPQISGSVSVAQATIDDDTGNLLKIVAHKFQQKEANLNAGFAAEREALRSELGHAHDSNKRLEGQINQYHVKCKKMTAEIHTFKTTYNARLTKFSKFLSGLGNDLASLRREGDNAKTCSDDARREVRHMQERLLIISEREQNLLSTKATHEKLLDTKSCDLQLVIEHRDSLRAQLDDRIGQLAEERDRSLAFRQRIRELEADERSSFGKHLDQFKESMLNKLRHIAKSDDSLALSLNEILSTVQKIGTKKLARESDCDKIKTAITQLSENIERYRHTSTELENAFTDNPNAHANEAVKTVVQELHNEFNSWRAAIEQHSSDGETESELSIQLQCSMKHNEELETKLLAAQASETSLNAAVGALTAQVRDLETSRNSPSVTPTRSQAAVESLVKDAETKAQKQMADNARAFQAEQQADFENRLRKTMNDRERSVRQLTERIDQLQELHNVELEQSKSKHSFSNTEAQQQLTEMRTLLQRQEAELKVAKACAAQTELTEAKYMALIAEAEATKSQLVSLQESQSSLIRQLDESKNSTMQSNSSTEQANTLLEKLREESEAAIADLKRQLTHAEDNSKRAEAGSAQMKSSSEKALQEAKEKNRKQIEALQERLAEAEAEVQNKSREMEDFRRSIEESWSQEQITWQDKFGAMERVVGTEKASREESTKVAEQMRLELDACRSELISLQALEEQMTAAPSATKGTSTPKESRDAVSTAVEMINNVTPTDGLGPTAPPKLRKKVDPGTNRVVETSPIPTSKAIRPRSRSRMPGKVGSHGPVEEHSQLGVNLVPKNSLQREVMFPATPKLITNSSNSDEMLDTAMSQGLRQIVTEAHFDEFPTTFAELNKSLASKAIPLKSISSLRCVPTDPADETLGSLETQQATPAESRAIAELKLPQLPQEPSFQIFEDSPGPSLARKTDRGEYDDDAYTFRMPMPKSNSASKRLPSDTSNGRTTRESHSRYRTPEVRDKAPMPTNRDLQAASRPSPSDHSSTPPFLNIADNQTMNKYQSSGGYSKAKRRASRTNSFQADDPRIIAKAVAQKRAAERESQQEYQPAPKRRMLTGIEVGNSRKSTDEQSVARSSQSVNDLPRITEPVRRTNSSSRMRTFGGSSSRAAGRRGKLSKNPEYSARFSQELGRR